MSFVHLHVHSEYSLLDGLSHVSELVASAKKMGMPGLALTDHGAMFGVIDFYRAAKKQGIKPVIGMETYLARRSMHDRDPQRDSRAYHLLLLAENDTGYRNLLAIATASQLEGFYYRPRIDHDFLAQHSEGLICTTGCLSGEVPRALLRGRKRKAIELLDWYYEVFGRDSFFIELQQHDISELPGMNAQLLELAGRYDGHIIATNDVHYIRPEDAELQDILLCIQTGSVKADPNRMRMTDPSYYMRSPEEMAQIFGDVPGALENTVWIAERCNVDLDFKGYHLPDFPVPDGKSAESYLRELCQAGLKERYGGRAGEAEVQERLDYELSIIHNMGFDAYFLIVWDLCRHAQKMGIWYNARGSAAGSIVAYALGITLVDPLEHGLIFERFLNPDRISMPDIDLDFQDDQRSLMLEYTAEKYGQDKVAQIITFGTLGARAAIRDVGRVMDIPLNEVDRVAKLVPNIPGKPMRIEEALEQVGAFREMHDSTPYMGELIDTASRLDGVVRNAGTHAAGVIITPEPITEYLPLHRPTGSSGEDTPIQAVTQFEMNVLDSLGLLKVDFLGLSTLTVMERACEKIRERHGVEFEIDTIPVDDPETYELLGQGEVSGVFQVEGVGMRRYLMEMKPKELANVVAMVALYRPGPMDFIPTYIKRMHGEEQVSYSHPKLKPIFQETYGIPVYQEQIMRSVMNLAGFSASEADGLRKAISKKDARALARHRERFIGGAGGRGIPEDQAAAIFDDWQNFARYGFNKAHAADYGTIAVQTAYLKAHYPLEYMTALLSVFKQDTDKIAAYITDCRRMGIEVLPPDVLTSDVDFKITILANGQGGIRFGLSAVKNVGEGAVRVMLEARERGGPFEDLEDFLRRVDMRQVGKRAFESLVRVGAFDCLGERQALLQNLDQVMAYSASHFRAKDVGQISLFGAQTGVTENLELPPTVGEVPQRRKLFWEKELLGVYVSDHPVTPYWKDLAPEVTHSSVDLRVARQNERVCVGGMVTGLRPYQTRSGKPMGFATIEDIHGQVDLVIFSRVWKRVADWLQNDLVVLAKGRVDRERGDPKVLVDSITADLGGGGDPGRRSSRQQQEPVKAPSSELGKRMAGETAVDLGEAQPPDGAASHLARETAEGETAVDLDEAQPPDEAASHLGRETAEGETALDLDEAQPPDGSAPHLAQEAAEKELPAGPPDETATNAAKPNGGERGVSRAPLAATDPDPSPLRTDDPGNGPPGNGRTEEIGPPRVAEGGRERQRLTVVLRATGDKLRDTRRMRRVQGLLTSYPGQDRYAFHIYEASRQYLLEFPNSTTGFCSELWDQLEHLLGPGSVRLESIVE
jgi:DNA polymerase-3 subunit alpha